jgi:hypothetical protein
MMKGIVLTLYEKGLVRLAAPFDLSRLEPDELKLWEEHFASGEDGEVVRVLGFAEWCNVELRGTPEVVGEYLAEHRDSVDRVHEYAANVRAAREEGR